jgi:S-layer homology domain.
VFKTFNDLAAYSWAKDSIETMASKGVINGTSETTFAPGENITRADFIVLLVNTLGLKAKVDSNFSDLKSTDYYYNAVGIAKSLGVTKGQGDNNFNPSEEISRQDMMVLTARAMRIANKLAASTGNVEISAFTDKSAVADYAAADISAMVKDGLIKGDNSTINPLGNATRAEVAVLMYRIYKK